MKNEIKVKKHEEAEKDYVLGMSTKDIAFKYKVKESTVRVWKTRYKWSERSVANETNITINGMTLNKIKESLIRQLDTLGKKNIQNIIEVEAYIDSIKDYYECKDDLTIRGHMVEWENGSQSGLKKNDSFELKYKTSAERRKIITHLGLDNVIKAKDDDDEDL